jgi:hypothetical protein
MHEVPRFPEAEGLTRKNRDGPGIPSWPINLGRVTALPLWSCQVVLQDRP